MPNEIITANNVNIAPLVEELNAYVKTKQVGDVNFEEVLSKLLKTNSPDWKLISGILCNSIVEWASQNANNGGKDLLVHLQSDIGYLMKRLGLTDS
jgi:alanine racemase